MQLVALAFVQFAPLQDLERFLLQRRFAGAVAHFGHALLVGGEFGVEFGEFDVDGFDVRVGLERVEGVSEKGGGERAER